MERILKISDLFIIKFPVELWKVVSDQVLNWNTSPLNSDPSYPSECNVRNIYKEGVDVYFKHVPDHAIPRLLSFLQRIADDTSLIGKPAYEFQQILKQLKDYSL